MIERPGIYLDMPTSEYFADCCPAPSLTQSVAKLLLDRSPLHAYGAHPRLGGEVDRPEDYVSAQAIGNAAHKLFLGRGKEIVVIEAPDFRTKEARTTRDAVSAEGKVPILAKHYGRANAMVKRAREQLAPFGLPDPASLAQDTEVVIAWEEDGIWLRSMIDHLTPDRLTVIDFKTSGMSCAPHGIGRMMNDAGWDVQAAMHERGLYRVDPEGAGRRRHLFIAQENEEPYALTVVQISEAVLTMGRKKLAVATDIWRRCIESDRWPGYPAEIVVPELPAWAESAWLDREETEFTAAVKHDLSQILMAG